MNAISLLCGTLFGLGLSLSGMILPSKVQNFLDLAGNWDPDLALVMTGALLVFMPGYYFLVHPRQASLSGDAFHLPLKRQVDRRLISGSALFGIGWGLVGICPGPAITSLVTGQWQPVLFVVLMLVGVNLAACLDKRRS